MVADYDKVNWPRCGEVDILEHLGRDPATAWHVTHRAGEDGKDISKSSAVKNSGLNDGQFHVVAVDWDADRIVWSIDGKETWRMPLDEATLKDGGNAFRRPHFLILDLSLGGWGGDPDPASFPARMEVDYVRVYRRRP
jgi:beta-glucanase (GH16 family)